MELSLEGEEGKKGIKVKTGQEVKPLEIIKSENVGGTDVQLIEVGGVFCIGTLQGSEDLDDPFESIVLAVPRKKAIEIFNEALRYAQDSSLRFFAYLDSRRISTTEVEGADEKRSIKIISSAFMDLFRKLLDNLSRTPGKK